MLIRFVVSNFLSFDKEVEFNMLSSSLKTHKHHVYKTGKLSVLKAAAIYGANGAGKSNLILAVRTLKDIVQVGGISRSFRDFQFKLNKLNKNKPTSFEIEFSISNKIYSYGISFHNSTIFEEWLYESGITKEDKIVFKRELNKSGKQSITMAPKYVTNKKAQLLIELLEESLLKSDETLLSKYENLKNTEINQVLAWFHFNLLIIFPHTHYEGLVPRFSESKRFMEFTNKLLKTFDTGIVELDIHNMDLSKFLGEDEENLKEEILEKLKTNKTVDLDSGSGIVIAMKEKGKYVVKIAVCKHMDNKGELINFEVEDESDGTQRLLDFIPACDEIINNDSVVFIDEIDQSLHTVLLHSLLLKIMSDTSTKGQLIFTTHESNLLDLDIFRQDEIWFAEKNKVDGATHLYSLNEFKPRFDLDIRKGYLKGRFGAIPFLANLERLNWTTHHA